MAFEIKIALATFVLHTLEQSKHIPTAPPRERAERLASLPLTAALILLPALWPRTYTAHRDVFLALWRVTFFSAPLLRSSRGIQRVLDAPAAPGPLGFLGDLVKIGWGSRLFATALSGVSLPLSFWPAQLAVQAYATTRVLSNVSLCATRLANDPVMVRRLASLTALACDALLPSAALGAVVEGRECAFTFTLLHLIFGVILPTLLVAPQARHFWGFDARGKLATVWMGLCLTWLAAEFLTAHAQF